jgi:glycosyltransferase involved in cell wall biosynthesis
MVERVFPRYRWTDRAFRQLHGRGYDLVHVHNFHGDYASVESLAWLAGRIPTLWTFHAFWGITGGCDHPRDCQRFNAACGSCPQVGVWPIGKIDDTMTELQRKAASLSRAPLHIIAPSRFLADTVKTSMIGRHWPVYHIPNGIDPSLFSGMRKLDPDFRAGLGVKPGKVAVLVVNRDFRDDNKGFSMVKEALDVRGDSGIQVILVGRNSAWAANQLRQDLDCIDAGYVSERSAIARWYEAADILLFASRAENFPCVVLEAMASECCVVSTPTGGVVEQVDSGVSGVLSASISGMTLAKALASVLDDGAIRRNMGLRARERVVREFGEDAMIEAHVRLYESIAGRRHDG